MAFKSLARTLVSYEIWPVIPAVGLAIALPQALPYSLLVILVFWPLRWFAFARLSVRTPVDIPILLLVLILPLTLWATARPEITQPQVFRLLVGIGLYYAIVNWADAQPKLRMLLLGTGLLLITLAILTPVAVEWGISKYNLIPISLYRYFPLLLRDTVNPNVIAGYLAILLPVVFAATLLNWRDQSPLMKIILLVSILLGLAALILTQSRGAWLALLLSLCVLLILSWRRGWLLILGLGLVTLTTVLVIGPAEIADVLMGGGQLQNIEGRLEVWSRAVYMIEDFSLTGVGIGMYMHVADLLYPFFLFAPGQIEHAHNLLLQVAVDLGLPGLVAWLAVYLGLAFSAWRLYRVARFYEDRLYFSLGAGLLASQAALFTHGLVDAVTWGMIRPAPLVWGLWGMLAAASNYSLTKRVSGA